MSDSNTSTYADKIPRNVKKSDFVADTSVGSAAYFDFIINGQNFKISKADFLTAMGATGTLEQKGEITGIAVLTKDSTINYIRNLLAGAGVTVELSAGDAIKLSRSNEHCLMLFRANATVTTIAVASTPVLIAGTWSSQSVSSFTSDAAGKITYTGSNDLNAKVTASFRLVPASGSGQELKFHLYKNGIALTNATQTVVVDSTKSETTSLVWRLTLSEDDYLEIYVSNETSTNNITVEDATVKVD